MVQSCVKCAAPHLGLSDDTALKHTRDIEKRFYVVLGEVRSKNDLMVTKTKLAPYMEIEETMKRLVQESRQEMIKLVKKMNHIL